MGTVSFEIEDHIAVAKLTNPDKGFIDVDVRPGRRPKLIGARRLFSVRLRAGHG